MVLVLLGTTCVKVLQGLVFLWSSDEQSGCKDAYVGLRVFVRGL